MIEMPDGWKDFVAAGNYSSNVRIGWRIEQASALMKEMAEALEFIRERELAAGRIGAYVPAWDILNKFQEWK